MRVHVALAWLLLGATLFTAALLRRFHERTAQLPFLPPALGSLLFAAVAVLLAVSVWESRVSRAPGRGVRLGSLTPIMLMLLVEKWASVGVYPPLFDAFFSPTRASDALADAHYRALAGAGLLVLCAAFGLLSEPAARTTWRRARPARWLPGLAGAVAATAATYAILAGLSGLLGGGLRVEWPHPSRWLFWVVAGQVALASAEETYYRGLLFAELERLGPRLGLRRPGVRRYAALIATSVLFALEHVTLGPEAIRQAVFTFSLGLLFGLLVVATDNLAFAAGLHAWINGLLLGAAPRLSDASGQPALPSGTYVGLALSLSFVLAFFLGRAGRATR